MIAFKLGIISGFITGLVVFGVILYKQIKL